MGDACSTVQYIDCLLGCHVVQAVSLLGCPSLYELDICWSDLEPRLAHNCDRTESCGVVTFFP